MNNSMDESPKKGFFYFAYKFKSIRTFVTDIIIAVAVIFFLSFIITDLFKEKPIHIEPFEIPHDLENQGYSGRVIANKLIDKLNEIGEKSKSSLMKTYGYSYRIVQSGSSRTEQVISLELEKFVPSWTEKKQLDIEVPGVGISLNSISQFIKGLFGKKPITVTGEIVRYNNKLIWTIRVGEKSSKLSEGENLDDILYQAAEQVYKCLKPTILAEYYFINKKDVDCLEIIKLIISKEPKGDDVLAYSLWGYIFRRQKKYMDAIEKFQKVIELDPELAYAYGGWGGVLADQRKYDEATEKYKKAIELDPELAYAYSNWGNVLAGQRKYDEATEKYKKAIELDPESAPAYGGWGAVLAGQRKYDEAVEKYKKAIELDPESAYAYSNWGSVLADQRKYDEAVEKYKKAIELDSGLAPAYGGWGDALANQGKYDEAIEKFKKAIELDPELAYAYSDWGAVLADQGKYDEAIEKYKKATELDPKLVLVYYRWGDVLANQRKFKEAIVEYEKVVKIDPEGLGQSAKKFIKVLRNKIKLK